MVIETARLRLRPYTADDVEPLRAVFADAYARQFYPLMGAAEALTKWIDWNLANYARDGFGLWALELRSDPGRLIGDCGLTYQQVEARRELEMGWHLLESERGKGYAIEAARACLRHAFAHTEAPLLCSIVDPANVASRSVAVRVHRALRTFIKNERELLLYYTERPARGLPTPDAMNPAAAISPLDVRVTRHFNVPAERVFDAWIDPTCIAQWFGPGLGDMVRIDVDARRGGRFAFTQRRGSQDVEHTGEYFVFDRPRRLAFTWAVSKQSNEFSRVGIDIRAGEGGCDLTLTHELLPEWAAYAERTREGWKKMIEVMAGALG